MFSVFVCLKDIFGDGVVAKTGGLLTTFSIVFVRSGFHINNDRSSVKSSISTYVL